MVTKVKPPQIEERVSVPCIHDCGSVDLLPDGSGALLGGWGGLWIVDIPSGKERRRLRDYTGSIIWNGRVSRDGKRAVGAFGDQTLHAWTIESGKETFATPTAGVIVTRISLSADGTRALTAALRDVRLWDIAKGQLVGAVELKKSFSNGVALSPNGQIAYYGGTDGMLRAHDFATNEPLWTSPGNGWIEDVDASADFVVTGGRGKSVVVWDAKTGSLVRTLDLGANISMVGISPDGRFAAALSGKKSPPIWDVATGKLLGVLSGHDGAVASLRFGHDSRTIATIDAVAKRVRVFDLPV